MCTYVLCIIVILSTGFPSSQSWLVVTSFVCTLENREIRIDKQLHLLSQFLGLLCHLGKKYNILYFQWIEFLNNTNLNPLFRRYFLWWLMTFNRTTNNTNMYHSVTVHFKCNVVRKISQLVTWTYSCKRFFVPCCIMRNSKYHRTQCKNQDQKQNYKVVTEKLNVNSATIH